MEGIQKVVNAMKRMPISLNFGWYDGVYLNCTNKLCSTNWIDINPPKPVIDPD